MSIHRWYRRPLRPRALSLTLVIPLVAACTDSTPTTPGPLPVASQRFGAADRWVSPGGADTGDCSATPCQTIGYAVSQAVAGDVISVASGTYSEAVLVTKQLTLVGHDATIDATGQIEGVVIWGAEAAGSRLAGFTVENAGLEGVFVRQTSDITIEDNIVTGNDTFGPEAPECVDQPDDCGEAIHLQSVTHSTVRDNLVQYNVGGILLTDENGPTSDNMISDNQVLDNTLDCGITLASHWFDLAKAATPDVAGIYRNTILHNTSSGNGAAGIGVFAGPPGAAAWGNVVADNTSTNNGEGGVMIHSHTPSQYVNDNVVTNNTLSGNGMDPDNPVVDAPEAISIFSAVVPIAHTVISGNRISDEHYGIITFHAMKLSGLPSNKFDASVAEPIAVH